MIGIFGGTFDPVHYGHLRAAVEAVERLDLPVLRLMPAGVPPHRGRPFATAADRLRMLRLAVEGHPELAVDDREIRRAGASYMVDTLSAVRAEAPAEPLLLLIGQDAANGLDTWHEWRRLFDLAHLVILRRPDSVDAYSPTLLEALGPRLVDRVEPLRDRSRGLVLPLDITQLDISSTDIRVMIANRRSPAFLLPEPVIAYIERHGLYRPGDSSAA